MDLMELMGVKNYTEQCRFNQLFQHYIQYLNQLYSQNCLLVPSFFFLLYKSFSWSNFQVITFYIQFNMRISHDSSNLFNENSVHVKSISFIHVYQTFGFSLIPSRSKCMFVSTGFRLTLRGARQKKLCAFHAVTYSGNVFQVFQIPI